MTDRAPAPADVEAIAEAAARVQAYLDSCLSEHEARSGQNFDVGDDDVPLWSNDLRLLASPALATLRAHDRAEALRDAADELHRLWVKDGRHYGHPGCYSSGYEVWLRDRADRQEES